MTTDHVLQLRTVYFLRILFCFPIGRCSKENHRDFLSHELLALAKALVNSISNLRFGPEVGVEVVKDDVPAVGLWRKEVDLMVDDLRHFKDLADIPSEVHQADARQMTDLFEPRSVDAVITSPPYPNEKDYTRTTQRPVGHFRGKTLSACTARPDDSRRPGELSPASGLEPGLFYRCRKKA